jgi:hypothetical protein
MWFSQSWNLCCVPTDAVKFKWNWYAAPAAPGSNGKTIVAPMHADTFVIVKQADKAKLDASWKVLQFLVSAEASGPLCQIYGCMPARKNARTDWEAGTLKTYPWLNVKVVYAAANYLDAPNNESYMPNYNEADAANAQTQSAIHSNPDLDVKKALNDLNTLEVSIFAGGKAPANTPVPTAAK